MRPRIPLMALALLATTACASQRAPLLPPDVSAEASYWGGAGATPLWRDGDRGAYDTRLRLMMVGPFQDNNRALIRIDRNADGSASGFLLRGERDARYRWTIREERRFAVSQPELRELDALIAQSPLWQTYPEYWVFTNPDDLCIDGVVLALERVNADGYRISQANAQCTAPPAYRAIVAHMMNISGETDLLAWLR